jgi:hypothetical protein
MNKEQELINKINDLIEAKRFKQGAMPKDITKVSLILSDKEKEVFSNSYYFDNVNYSYDFDDNKLTIFYVEEI